MRETFRLHVIIAALAVVLSGCATGKTEFKVIKITPQCTATPTPEPQRTPPSGKQATPEVVPAAAAQPALQTYVVAEGDCLWRISARFLGDPRQYPVIARKNNISNPDLIHPGQVLQWETMAAAEAGIQPATPAIQPAPPGKPQDQAKPSPTGTATVVFPQRTNAAFGPGESLTFSVEYFGISAGYATLAVQKGPEMHGRPILHLVATARTHPAFEWFFVVRDRIESFFDAQGLFSWRYEKHLREGSYSNDSYMVYDQINRQVIKDKGRTVIPAMPWVQDILSEFYYYRTLNIRQLGQKTAFPVVADDGKSYEVVVETLRRETVAVPAGKFKCIVVQPHIKFEGVFQQKGKMEIWLTDDKRQVPVLIKSAIIIGTIDIVLREAVVVDLP
ncbi:DUF3108 domain-containing protein [candidate division FCPU426 bacterium]|nr:DUF3108 domain-containing protein [candidate division FCPU426 bacterium]